MRVIDDHIHLNPYIPDGWKAYSFRVNFRKHILKIKVTSDRVEILNHSDSPLQLYINNKMHTVEPEKIEAIIA